MAPHTRITIIDYSITKAPITELKIQVGDQITAKIEGENNYEVSYTVIGNDYDLLQCIVNHIYEITNTEFGWELDKFGAFQKGQTVKVPRKDVIFHLACC